MRHRATPPRSDAFTIIELLVVIIIVIVLIGLSVPAFKSLIESSERSLAENQLRVGLASARDAAIQSTSGDAAAVFMFTPGGKVSIVPCVSVGTLEDDVCLNSATPLANRTAKREVFVPVPNARPIQLPRGWSVRGFAPPNTVSTVLDFDAETTSGWYDSLSVGPGTDDAAAMRHWLFPETHFVNTLDSSLGDKGYQRQTFIVRFKAGTGVLDTGNLSSVLVFDPVAVPYGSGFRATGRDPWGLDKNIPANRSYLAVETSEPVRFVSRLLARTPANANARTRIIRTIGDRSIDTILARPVGELAVYSERSLSGALSRAFLGARGLNRITNTVYAEPERTGLTGPTIDPNLFGPGVTAQAVNEVIGKWIEGRATENNAAPSGANGIETDARIFTLQQYLGHVQELTQ